MAEARIRFAGQAFLYCRKKVIRFPYFLSRGTILCYIKSFSRCAILEFGVGGHVDRLTRRRYKHDLSFNLEVMQCLSVLSKNNYEVTYIFHHLPVKDFVIRRAFA